MTERVVAIIPARGGSKGVPGKNIARVGGVPLVARAVHAALASGEVDAAYVSTDDRAIAEAATAAGGSVIERPAEIAGDTASSEAAVLHALGVLAERGVHPAVVAFLQATSPFIDATALGRAIRRVRDGQEDVVFSAFETYGFLWRQTPDGAVGVNHDHSFRPRRQDREPHYQETGAFYVMDAAGFAERGFRFFGTVGVEQTAAQRAVEIDDLHELEIARVLAPHFDAPPPGIDIDALVMDFDGVHTDDLVSVDQDGRESVRVSRMDGLGLELLRKAGLPMLILSKERNPVVAARGRKLQIEVLQGVDEKLSSLRAWCAEHGFELDKVAYVGNDINDAPCLEAVGWPIVVPQAHPDVLPLARVVLTRAGGQGALRELAELILAGRKESKQ
ncbi:MAG: acylneuraminate cytidylyltransferase [Microbacterium sp.]|nr:acylneuraminate cytidylyltransferase [Microbacterium sp.]